MASSYTTRLRLEKQATGENTDTWGTILNNNTIDMVDEAISGYVTLSVAGNTNVTLSTNNGAADEARNHAIHLTGALTGNISVIVPTAEGRWIIYNATSGNFTLTVKTSGGSGIAVTQGKKAYLYCDGTDVLKFIATDDFEAANVAALKANNLSDLANVTTARTNLGLGNVSTLNVGTAANNVVQLDSNAALPAVSGANLTGIRKQGLETIHYPAGAMTTRTTNGAASGTTESTTNKVMRKTLDFDAATAEYAQFTATMPKSWNEGTVTFVPYWTAASGSGDVIWGLQAVALSNDDAIDTAFGTAQTSTDTLITANDVHVGPTSSAITIAGSPADGDEVIFQVYRDAAAGGDTLAVDAKLIAVKILFTTNAADDT